MISVTWEGQTPFPIKLFKPIQVSILIVLYFIVKNIYLHTSSLIIEFLLSCIICALLWTIYVYINFKSFLLSDSHSIMSSSINDDK
jgi:phosphoglycerol transferase MdoB-like AlkP superfamily enzyme